MIVKGLDAEKAGKKNGIGVLVAVLFIVGEIAGTGMLAFPHAMKGIGWFGPLVIVIGCLGGGYAGVVLGKSWLILEDRDPALQKVTTRNPYSLIGFAAAGVTGRAMTTITLILMLFGSAVVQMLIFAETIQSLIPENHFVSISFCKWIILVGIILLPFSLLGSPVDFAPVAFFAMSSTTIASLLIVIAIFREDAVSLTESETAEHNISIKTVLLGISTIVFGYGGASVLPTIQNDMRDKRKFTGAVVFAFGLMMCLYVPVSAIGYWKFGDHVKSNIVRNLTPSPLVTVIECLVLAHVFCAFLIQLNPVNLTIESMLGLDHSFNWKRSVSRSFLITLAIFTGQAIPKFGKLLNLLGAVTVTMQSYILPAIFYYLLCPPAKSTLIAKTVLIGMIVMGVVISISSSFFALVELFHPDAFTRPCFICDCVKLD